MGQFDFIYADLNTNTMGRGGVYHYPIKMKYTGVPRKIKFSEIDPYGMITVESTEDFQGKKSKKLQGIQLDIYNLLAIQYLDKKECETKGLNYEKTVDFLFKEMCEFEKGKEQAELRDNPNTMGFYTRELREYAIEITYRSSVDYDYNLEIIEKRVELVKNMSMEKVEITILPYDLKITRWDKGLNYEDYPNFTLNDPNQGWRPTRNHTKVLYKGGLLKNIEDIIIKQTEDSMFGLHNRVYIYLKNTGVIPILKI